MSAGFKKPTKVWIGSLDANPGVAENAKFAAGVSVEAQYNPGTLEVSQNVPWKKPDAASKTGGTGTAAQKADRNDVTLEFTGAEGRSISLELLFDGVEAKESVTDQVHKLETLAAVREAGSSTLEKRRPHHCVVVWANVLPRFKCVIESLTTKYTMFALDGTPLRATCTLKLKEAENVQRAKDKKP